MAKYRVAVIGTVGKSVLIDDSLSSRVARLETQIATVGGVTRHSQLLGLQQGDDHPQYTMWAAPETIAAPWNFSVIPFIQGETLAEYIEDVVAGGSDPFIADSPSITWTYDDTGNHLQADVVDEYIEDLVGSMLVNTTYIDLDYGDSDGSIKAILDTGAVLDLVGTAAFQDSSTIDFTYDSGTKRTSAAVVQSYAYTWTNTHVFTQAFGVQLRSTDPAIVFYDTDGNLNAKGLLLRQQNDNFLFQLLNDAENATSDVIKGNRTGLVLNFLEFGSTDSAKIRLPKDNQELQIGASQDLRMYHDGTNSIVRTDTGSLRLQFSTNNRMEVNTTGVGFNGATPITRPDYTVTNPTTNRSIDVSTITHAQLAQVVGTMIQDFINYGLYQ